MSMNDPISDLLTRIRNAGMVSKPWVDIPCSNQKIRILYILKEEYFIRDYVKIKDNNGNKPTGVKRINDLINFKINIPDLIRHLD